MPKSICIYLGWRAQTCPTESADWVDLMEVVKNFKERLL